MNMRTIVPLMLAVMLGLVTVKYGLVLLQQKHVEPQGPTRQVLIATDELAVGHAIVSGDFQTVDAPLELVPAQGIHDIQPTIGRVLASPVCKGQMLTETVFAPAGTTQGLQAAVPRGKRAFTVEVNDVSGLAGMVTPGCDVDVITTLTDDEGHDSFTRTVVENVPVTAVGSRMNANSPDEHDLYGKVPIRTVTLLVTPEQAELLDMAYTKSKPRLVLRNASETEPGSNEGLRFTKLLHGPEWRASQAKASLDDFFSRIVSARKPVTEETTYTASDERKAAPIAATPVSAPPQRMVTIIRGAVESTVYFKETPAEAATSASQVAKKSSLPDLITN